ncbi:MAG: L-aspartate oxidase [Chloroflexi bacterium]|nr:L-aspartate oxidase [Chloroflexota bacterium]
MQAMHLGAKLRDMEFVQWHPTRLDEPVPMFLTNGLLADGAIFRDASGRPFMADYDKRADLAPRDILAKAIYTEARAGRGLGTAVYLDCSPIPEGRIALRHGHLAGTLRKHGVDFPRQWLVVSPATHFLMGGIAIDTNARSSIHGLYAVGESAGGLHGANRLGGNAFSEGLVFGTIAGQHAARALSLDGHTKLASAVADTVRAEIDPTADDPKAALSTMWHTLREEMWQDASVVRDAAALARAAQLIGELTEEGTRLRGRSPREVARILDFRAGLQCAAVIVASATYREESRGAHWRSDFPETSEAWFGSVWVTWPSCQQHPTLQFKHLTSRPPSL